MWDGKLIAIENFNLRSEQQNVKMLRTGTMRGNLIK